MKEESYCVCIVYIQICDNFCQWKTKMVHSALTFQASSIHYVYADWGLIGHIWGLWCLKQISQAWINNCIPQNTVRCNYLPLPEVPASGTQVSNIRHWTGLSLLTTLLHLLFWNQKASLDNQMVWDCESHPALWEVCVLSACYVGIKVRLHGTRQAARLARDMLQRDLLRGNSIYMVGSSRARLLHIIHVSAFLGLFWGRCSSKKTEATARDSMCRAAIISSNLYCRPGSQQSRVCCVQRVAM